MTPAQATRTLAAALPGRVHLDAASRDRAGVDSLRLRRRPLAVVTPEGEDDIQELLRLANEHGVPVTVRGAGSATTGAAVPIKGGWVLDLAAWNQVEIDPLAMVAYAQPGVTIEALDAAARAHGLFYPPDPGSKKHCTLGGNLACNAGGLRGAKYGVTRDYAMALEGFLPTGEFVRWGADLRKYAAGYNLRDLWIGSEGTLGVITGAVVRLLPTPAATLTALAQFADEATALAAVKQVLGARLMPSILEFLDTQTVACTVQALRAAGDKAALGALPESLRRRPSPVLLVELDGDKAAVRASRARLVKLLTAAGGQVTLAADAAEAERLWTIRRRCSRSMFQMGDTKLNEDVVVPLAAQEELLAYTLELKAQTGLATPTFGHAADGNFHVHIMYNYGDPEHRRRARVGIRALMEKVVELGGAISGEHGIGLAKSPFISLQHGPAELGAMRRIKQALDPRGILNPGKIFDSFEIWKHPRAEVHFPWDH